LGARSLPLSQRWRPPRSVVCASAILLAREWRDTAVVARARKSGTQDTVAADAPPGDLYDCTRPPARRACAGGTALSRLGLGDFVGLNRPRLTERKRGSDRRQKRILSAVFAPHARKPLSEIEFRQITRQAVSDRNVRRKQCSPEKNRLNPMG
jgi:hypothetical protein